MYWYYIRQYICIYIYIQYYSVWHTIYIFIYIYIRTIYIYIRIYIYMQNTIVMWSPWKFRHSFSLTISAICIAWNGHALFKSERQLEIELVCPRIDSYGCKKIMIYVLSAFSSASVYRVISFSTPSLNELRCNWVPLPQPGSKNNI